MSWLDGEEDVSLGPELLVNGNRRDEIECVAAEAVTHTRSTHRHSVPSVVLLHVFLEVLQLFALLGLIISRTNDANNNGGRSPKNRTNLKKFGTAQKCQFSETMCFGVLEGADDDARVISMQFDPGERVHLKLALLRSEKTTKNKFRRDVVWSQRGLNMKNKYAHRHQHHREPRNT
ncbi:hypothetical protein PRIPAC_87820 [Pristionchus pacificus]|uniref:Uncharacterized protein n=1 Tax=Pristionchus pacificus TaxID=54126 RepID=A0A2A6CVC0_PRIPA|nr:hypothetical protein PRIPAC_87820 [Pristionchus pacificus]|eukprot:PDM82125.1 hypothetical protein PRIPAC_36518 [Pristionchus pacificus]